MFLDRRLFACVLVLLSQWATSLVVLCDEADGSQVVEFAVSGCTGLDGASSRSESPPRHDDCGDCQDTFVGVAFRAAREAVSASTWSPSDREVVACVPDVGSWATGERPMLRGPSSREVDGARDEVRRALRAIVLLI